MAAIAITSALIGITAMIMQERKWAEEAKWQPRKLRPMKFGVKAR